MNPEPSPLVPITIPTPVTILDPIHKSLQFSERKPDMYKKACTITGDIHILAKIYDNTILFNKVFNSGCKIFVELVYAMFELENSADNTVLIHFTEIDLYGLFGQQSYLDFIKNINDKIEDDNISVNLYQVVIGGSKQKLVFACTDVVYFEKLQNYARDCFKVNISNSSNQITVDIITQNESEISDNYNKLYNFIYNSGDSICCESMKQIQLLQKMQYKYRRYACNDTLTARNMEELIKLLKSATHITINAPVNIVMGNVNNINVNKIAAVDKFLIAKEWIRNNLPVDKEVTTKYYERYITGIIDPVVVSHFGKLVRDEGYETARGNNNCRYWKK